LYWYKDIIEMLKHHASWLADKLRGRRLESVDILLGGDHGSIAFRMIVIVFFRFADGSTTKIPFFAAKIAGDQSNGKIFLMAFVKSAKSPKRKSSHGLLKRLNR
jgi:hypothetical protein